MPKSKKNLTLQKPKSPNAVDQAFKRALGTVTSLGLTSPPSVELPGNMQMQVDVHVCLLDAMTDDLPIKRSDIDANTVPSKPPIGANAQGWSICLAHFGEYLHKLRQIYTFYVHKPCYTEETIDKRFPEIVLYLTQKILDQIPGRR
jgi:hypothetical protein